MDAFLNLCKLNNIYRTPVCGAASEFVSFRETSIVQSTEHGAFPDHKQVGQP